MNITAETGLQLGGIAAVVVALWPMISEFLVKQGWLKPPAPNAQTGVVPSVPVPAVPTVPVSVPTVPVPVAPTEHEALAGLLVWDRWGLARGVPYDKRQQPFTTLGEHLAAKVEAAS